MKVEEYTNTLGRIKLNKLLQDNEIVKHTRKGSRNDYDLSWSETYELSNMVVVHKECSRSGKTVYYKFMYLTSEEGGLRLWVNQHKWRY